MPFFCLFFVYGCVINFCGSFLSLFWCYLIKNEINISKKKNYDNNKKFYICDKFLLSLRFYPEKIIN